MPNIAIRYVQHGHLPCRVPRPRGRRLHTYIPSVSRMFSIYVSVNNVYM